MTELGKDGTSIARLTNASGTTIGWAVRWENSELSVLWLGDDRSAVKIDPPLDTDTLEAAKAVCNDSITELLESLSTNKIGQSNG